MNCEEFSNQFDTLINAYAVEHPFGYPEGALEFNEYEKSVFLTEAQNDLILGLYNGNNSLFRESYEETEQLRKYLTNLVCTFEVKEESEGSGLEENTDDYPPYSSNNNNEKYYKIELDNKVLFIVWEGVMIDGKFRDVVPVKYDEWLRISRNPFRQPNKKWRALRLDTGENIIELISADTITSYHMRYVKKPSPIILINLGDLSIEGQYGPKDCELNPVLHPYILDIAIQKALTSRALTNKSNV